MDIYFAYDTKGELDTYVIVVDGSVCSPTDADRQAEAQLRDMLSNAGRPEMFDRYYVEYQSNTNHQLVFSTNTQTAREFAAI